MHENRGPICVLILRPNTHVGLKHPGCCRERCSPLLRGEGERTVKREKNCLSFYCHDDIFKISPHQIQA